MQIVIGDIHFGRYNNSQVWLNSQVEFVRGQIFDAIDKYKKKLDSVIFLGDVFENRNSVNVLVGNTVKELFRDIIRKMPEGCQLYILAGNHDFYTPIEEQCNINAYELLFGKEFLDAYPNFHIAINDPQLIGENLLLPWYCTENQDRFLEYIEKYKSVSVIYCHADVLTFDSRVIEKLKEYRISVYSGHIHIPSIQNVEGIKMWQMGACLPLDFNDVNSSRSFYVLDNGRVIEKITNTTTLQFRRYYNEEIFNLCEDNFKNATTELCIDNSLINTARYIEQINYLRNTFTDYKIEIKPIEENVVYENDESLSVVTNISEYIENNIPSHLQEKFNYIKDKVCS